MAAIIIVIININIIVLLLFYYYHVIIVIIINIVNTMNIIETPLSSYVTIHHRPESQPDEMLQKLNAHEVVQIEVVELAAAHEVALAHELVVVGGALRGE